jgi:nucleoside phosphorylase
MDTKPRFDLGIVVPLGEEFQYVIEVTPLLRSIPHGGSHFHVLDFGRFSAVACLVGDMGLLAAQHATQKLLDFAEITLLAMLGTAGALDEDLAIGDVAIATEINEFQANSRAETADDHYEFRYSGRHWPMEYRIRQSVGNFEFAGRQAFETWQATAARYYNDMQISNKSVICTPPPTLHLGNIASGNVVVASKVFAAESRRSIGSS